MRLQFTQTISTLNRPAIANLKSNPNGPVGGYIRRRAERIALAARADAPKKTGRLARSIKVTYYYGLNPYVTIGSDLDYAKDVHDGTRPHLIAPEKARVLRFVVRGRVIYAREVHHPGTRPNKFLERHLRKAL